MPSRRTVSISSSTKTRASDHVNVNIADSKAWKIAIAFFVVIVVALVNFTMQSPVNINDDGGGSIRFKTSSGNNSTVLIASTDESLVPGELPGYTGWARKEDTLAGKFKIISISTQRPQVGMEFNISVGCIGDPEDCSSNSNGSYFYLRAYGPSVISGLVIASSNDDYRRKGEGQQSYTMSFLPMDPGRYTVEVVLTFSNPPPFNKFPLPSSENEPPYEGYLLPGFPLQIQVMDMKTSNTKSKPIDNKLNKQWCTSDQLTVSTSTEALKNYRWKVAGKSNTPDHIAMATKEISEEGYKQGINSLGIHMDYRHLSDCVLLPHIALNKQHGDQHPFHSNQCNNSKRKNLQIMFMGDSTMRIQKSMFDEMIDGLSNIKTSYVNLYGGYRRCEKFGKPDIQAHLEDKFRRRASDESIVILFNTGLHDIHRLCGREWEQDRYEYLDKNVLDSDKFSCTEEYRSIIKDFATLVASFPADLRIFQSSTSAWPKYGNFGIEWKSSSSHGETLPVAPDSVAYFNDIAFDVLKDFTQNETISVVDGYWITHSRPDNREIGSIGSKLSHPGLEVQSAMVRIWAMLALQKVCNTFQ